ncbi:DNA polymerase III subunit delta [Thalassotalea maritima]|uniref:DNA polymerase III subunit delta n=1 Tax=Thalassotalea maritima TaxID=3242416 RepID=UPI003527A984
MRIYHSQLSKQLSQSLANTFAIFGDEPWQKNDALAQIKQVAKQQGYDELIRFSVEESFDFADVMAEFQSLSLFASLRIIEIDLGSAKLDDKASNILIDIATLQKAQQTDVLLIVHGGKLDSATARKKWFKAIEQAGTYIPVYELEGKGLSIWLNQQCQRLNIKMSHDAQRMLIDFFAGNTPALAQELEKLALLYGQHYLDVDALEQLLIRQAKFTPFQLTDALLAGQLSQIQDMLTQMKHEGIAAQQLIWVLHRQITELEKMHLMLKSGAQQGDVFKQFKVWDKKKPLYQHALATMTLANIKHAKMRLAQVDLISKTASDFDVFILLSDVCISLYHGHATQTLPLDYEYIA